jgi:hypothetical protein
MCWLLALGLLGSWVFTVWVLTVVRMVDSDLRAVAARLEALDRELRG